MTGDFRQNQGDQASLILTVEQHPRGSILRQEPR